MQQCDTKIEEILQEIKTLKQDIRELSQKIDEIKLSSTKMVNHIDFVENVYDNIKKPFHFVMNKISTIQLINYE